MYEPLPEKTNGPVVGFKLSDQITAQDLESVRESVGVVIEQVGVVRLYIELDAFPAPAMGSLDQDLKFILTHREYFDRVAVIGTHPIPKWGIKMLGYLTGVEFRWFTRHESHRAWAWIQAG